MSMTLRYFGFVQICCRAFKLDELGPKDHLVRVIAAVRHYLMNALL
jgi:hypothetical protein